MLLEGIGANMLHSEFCGDILCTDSAVLGVLGFFSCENALQMEIYARVMTG